MANTGISAEFIAFIDVTTAISGELIRVDGRNERCDLRRVISTRYMLRLPGTATHLGRVDAQIVAKEVHLFIHGCADDADLF